MKIYPGFVIVLVILFSSGCASQSSKDESIPKSASQKAKPELSVLYILQDSNNTCKEDQRTPDNQKFPVDKLDTALDSLLSRSGDTDAIILYVHGRAAGQEKEPDKSLKSVMPCLERDNTAKVLMFYWPGSAEGGGLGFPDVRAREAGAALGQVVSGFAIYKEANSNQFRNRKVVLLLHSMGNIVFEEFVDKHQSAGLRKNLFDTVILSASATKTKGHAKWLKKVLITEHLYVTVNENDPIIDKLGMRERAGRLGKKLRTLISGNVALADNAEYVNFDKAGIEKHRYFIKSGNSDVEKFFDRVLIGKPVNLDRFDGVEKIEERDGAKIYFFKKR